VRIPAASSRLTLSRRAKLDVRVAIDRLTNDLDHPLDSLALGRLEIDAAGRRIYGSANLRNFHGDETSATETVGVAGVTLEEWIVAEKPALIEPM
jgi:hypothetical protein